ncbi:MAG: cupredoxin domain-containing protein [Anaerolineae bacterium]
MSRRFLIAGTLLILLSLLIGCSSGPDPAITNRLDALESQAKTLESQAGAVSLSPSSVTFDVSVIEIKGATDGIPAPDVNPRDLSDGYRFKPPGEYDPDNPDKWQVSTYMFSPAAMMVAQGDNVTLRTFVINGDEHTVWVEAPDGSTAASEVIMNRGREYSVTFTSDQAGYYTLHCDEHDPTMSATILSLPSGG